MLAERLRAGANGRIRRDIVSLFIACVSALLQPHRILFGGGGGVLGLTVMAC
jgi:hypothetical protein